MQSHYHSVGDQGRRFERKRGQVETKQQIPAQRTKIMQR